MSDDLLIDDAADVNDALHDERLIPPPEAPAVGSGELAALRSSMARFSSGSDHTARRAGVDAALARIVPSTLSSIARSRTADLLGAQRIDALELALLVPVESLLIALGIDAASISDACEEVAAVVRVIGRGEQVDAAADVACRRLLDRLADHPDGAVAAVSLLYQVFDSTAALFASAALAGRSGDAGQSGDKRRNALSETVRVAVEDTLIGGRSVGSGDEVRLSLESPELEFGAGPHRCPGVAHAWAIVDAMRESVYEHAYDLVDAEVERRPDGRAATLPMQLTNR